MHQKARITFLFIFCFQILMAQNRSDSKKDQNYIFFLHNKYVEDQGPDATHPEYGKVEYHKILDAFSKENFIVRSELRPKNTDVNSYAQKLVLQIDSLIKSGVQPKHITVIGTSKGGYIAMKVSGMLKNKELNFVFIGCCSTGADTEINFCGNILSIYEKSDVIGESCQTIKERSTNAVSRYKEIELNTGLKHGFLFKALQEWIQPSIQWAKENGR
jgi:hypothetical protein